MLGLGSAVPGVLGVGGVRGVAGVGLVCVGAVGLGVGIGIGVRVGVGIGAVPGSVCVAVGGVFVAGVLLALAGGFAGASDSSVMRAAVYRDKPSREAFRMDGTPEVLEYELSMSGFTVEDDGSGGVRNYMADVVVDGVETRIRVNHPYGRTLSEDIYLVSYDRSGGEPE